MIIKNLTYNEKRYITTALQTLLLTSPTGSTAHWAASVMLEEKDGTTFVDRLMISDKEQS